MQVHRLKFNYMVDERMRAHAAMESSDEVFCPHCGREVAKKTYQTHKRLYYDSDTDQLERERQQTAMT